jgi:uncharacterized protein YbdZ (MbtH family)
MADADEGQRACQVVHDPEEQYSVWLTGRDQSPGWTTDATAGPEDDCPARMAEVWTDMRGCRGNR